MEPFERCALSVSLELVLLNSNARGEASFDISVPMILAGQLSLYCPVIYRLTCTDTRMNISMWAIVKQIVITSP